MNDNRPRHYFMVASLISYTRLFDDGSDKTGTINHRHMNAILQTSTKKLSLSALSRVRLSYVEQLADELGESFGGIQDINFLNFIYLGLMKPSEFSDIPEQQERAH